MWHPYPYARGHIPSVQDIIYALVLVKGEQVSWRKSLDLEIHYTVHSTDFGSGNCFRFVQNFVEGIFELHIPPKSETASFCDWDLAVGQNSCHLPRWENYKIGGLAATVTTASHTPCICCKMDLPATTYFPCLMLTFFQTMDSPLYGDIIIVEVRFCLVIDKLA